MGKATVKELVIRENDQGQWTFKGTKLAWPVSQEDSLLNCINHAIKIRSKFRKQASGPPIIRFDFPKELYLQAENNNVDLHAPAPVRAVKVPKKRNIITSKQHFPEGS